MKKIVGILAAAAVLATSAFATDVGAMVQIDGNLFNTDGGFKAMELNAYDPSGSSDYLWKLSVNGDNAGGYIYSYDALKGDVSEYAIWAKPLDMVKVTFGAYEYKMNNGHFGWWASAYDYFDYGYVADINVGSLAVNVALGQAFGAWASGNGGDYWYDSTKKGLAALGDFNLAATYDLGSAGNIKVALGRGVKVNPHGFSQTHTWARTPFAIGAGYSNQPWGQTGYFADVVVAMKENGTSLALDNIVSQQYVEYHADALTLYFINVCDFVIDTTSFKDGIEAKATYAIGSIVPFVQIWGYNIMNDPFAMDVELGATGNWGSMAWTAGVYAAINDGVKISAPIEVQVNF